MICSRCGKDDRCESVHGSYRCQLEHGHSGAHLVDTGRGEALRWGMVGYGCFDPDCVLSANHPMPHTNRRGSTWIPIDEQEALTPAQSGLHQEEK